MAITVELPGPLREQAGGRTEITVAGSTVGACLADLVRQYPALEPKLFVDGQVRPHINVFFRGPGSATDEDIRYHDELNTPVADGTVILIIPAVAGG